MIWQTPPLLIPLGIAALISAFLVFYIHHNRQNLPGALPLVLLQGMVFIWAVGHAVSWASVGLDVKNFSSKIQYIPVATTPLLWLIFVLHYLNLQKYLTRSKIFLASLIPFTTIILKWTNEAHHLLWREYGLVNLGPYTRMQITSYGAWFWVHSAYSYILMALGTGLLINGFFKVSDQRRKQVGALLVGISAPWIVNFLYLTRTSPFEGLDLTPFALTFTGMSITWGLLYYKTPDINNITRQAIAESINDGIIVINGNEHIVDINSVSEKILGQSKDKLIGKPIGQILPQWAEFNTSPQEALKLKIENNTYYYDLNVSLITNAQGRKLGRAIVLRDITTRKHIEQEVVNALQEAEKASKMKTRLIANISHDLRSPMGAILGYSEILQSGIYGEITTKQRNAITEILDNGEELLNFINNLLGQSQLETGAFKLNPKPIPSERVFMGIQASARSLARAKGLEIITDINPNMPETITGDTYWLNQIIINLVSNAVKFTDQGYIKIWLQAENEDYWSINVEDTGHGLPEEIQAQILEPKKHKPTTASPTSRSQLGLSIVKQVAKLMDGYMKFQSTPNRGSTFTVTLPFTPAQG